MHIMLIYSGFALTNNNSIQNLSLDSLWIVVDKIQRCGPSIDDV